MRAGDSFLPLFVGNAGALFTAAAYMSLKKAAQSFSAYNIVFVFGICTVAVSLAWPGDWIYPRPEDLFSLFGIGLLGLLGQIFLTKSHTHLTNASAAALTLLTSVFLILYDAIWTAKLVDGAAIVGNVVILMGVLFVIFSKSGHRAPPPTKAVVERVVKTA